MSDGEEQLRELRGEIDGLDERIGDLVAERLAVVEEIAATKTEVGVDVTVEDREEEVVSRYERTFERRGLEADEGRRLAEFLIEMSKTRQRELGDGG